MTATSVDIDTKYINNPDSGTSSTPDFSRVNTTLSYYVLLSENIRTLSTTGASVGASPNGLIYVPDIDPDSTCANLTAPYIPRNVTRLSDLPEGYSVIAIAPWTTINCTQAFLASARQDPYVRAFITYLPNQGDAEPPPASDPAWVLNDGGQWKGQNQYPVYALPSSLGQDVINHSADYSGNMSSVPDGAQLIQIYGDDQDYIRLYMTINLSLTSGLPSLWIFLVIILAILVSVVGIVSIAMHFIQRHRRADLRRRVANGQVDLETLGVKRLMVPSAYLDKMPLYTYEKTGEPAPMSTSEDLKAPVMSPIDAAGKGVSSEKGGEITKTQAPSAPLSHFDQPTCAICLEDFVAGESQVRQLPCEHIFHPECVDTFLKRTSSLCPLCKKSALPAGFCPDLITNAMVRRERILRRARQRAERQGLRDGEARAGFRHHHLNRFRRRLPNQQNQNDVEMNAQSPQSPQGLGTDVLPPLSSIGGPSSGRPAIVTSEERRQVAIARTEALLGPNAAPRDPEAEQTRDPAWRRGLRRVFPAMQ